MVIFYSVSLLINTLIFGIIAVLVSSLINQRVGSYFGGVIWSKLNGYLTPMFVKVTGKQNIDRKRSYVIISNHQSLYDIFLVYGWLGIDIKWVMKKELAKDPRCGFWQQKSWSHISLTGQIAGLHWNLLMRLKRKLVNGISVVIFPEGTRSMIGQPGEFKKGAFKLALDLGLPIFQLPLQAQKNILPTGTLDLRPGKVNYDHS